jgi:hypothetical protein
MENKVFFELEEECKARYVIWMRDKGIHENYEKEFTFCAEVFMNFVYGYDQDDKTMLKVVNPTGVEEFLFDYIFRKVSMKPHEYVLFPPAIKTFYLFLGGKGYMVNPKSIIARFDNRAEFYSHVEKNSSNRLFLHCGFNHK